MASWGECGFLLCPPQLLLCLYRAAPQLDTVLGQLSQVLLLEGQRLKAWGILGMGTGAELLQPGEPCSASTGVPWEICPHRSQCPTGVRGGRGGQNKIEAPAQNKRVSQT